MKMKLKSDLNVGDKYIEAEFSTYAAVANFV